MTAGAGHVPVLLSHVLSALAPAPGVTLADLTAGRGGHAEALARAAGPGTRVFLGDLDPGNLAHALQRVRSVPGAQVESFHGSFAIADHALRRLGWQADCVLADLGFASSQMDDPARGFSFRADGPLDMRLDPTRGETAAELLARLPERDLADAIFRLGEDPFARRIARAVSARQAAGGIRGTQDLAAAVVDAYGPKARASRMHPATRTFMALRILVNDELGALRGLLEAVRRGAAAAMAGNPAWLAPGARIAVIAFHSLEDRLVKQAMSDWEAEGLGRRSVRKPVVAADDEVAANPRARTAKLRTFRVASTGDPSEG